MLNFQFLTCALVVVVLSVLAWRFRRQAQDMIGYESYAFVALVVAANFVALWTLNQEIISYFHRQAVALERATPDPMGSGAGRNQRQIPVNHLPVGNIRRCGYRRRPVATPADRPVGRPGDPGAGLPQVDGVRYLHDGTGSQRIHTVPELAFPGLRAGNRADAGVRLVAPARATRTEPL